MGYLESLYEGISKDVAKEVIVQHARTAAAERTKRNRESAES